MFGGLIGISWQQSIEQRLSALESSIVFDTDDIAGGTLTHNLLSATHGDTTAASVARGALIVGQGASPTWAKLAIGGATGSVVTRDASDVAWSGYYLTGTAGGTTTLAVTNTKTLTLTATDSYNLTIPKTGSAVVGTGTANYISKWSGDANTQADSLIRDDGTTTAIGVAPVANQILTISTATATNAALVLKTSDNSVTKNLLEGQLSTGALRFLLNPNGQIGIASGTAAVLGSNSDVIYSNAISTSTSGTRYGIRSLVTANAGSASSENIYSMRVDVQTNSGNAQNYTGQLFGVSFLANHRGSGTVSLLIGADGDVQINSAGVVTAGIGVRSLVRVVSGGGSYSSTYNFYATSPSGTRTNSYGLYIEAISGAATLNYAIYTNAGLNHFGDAVDLASGASLTFVAGNIITDTTTGTKIGTSVSQKLSLWNATPIVQPSGATQAAPAAYATGAFGLDSDAHMQALYDLVVAMRTALVNTGIMKGAA